MIQPSAYQVPRELRLAAIARLLGLPAGGDMGSARRFVAEAPDQGVDLDLMWAWGVPPEPATARGRVASAAVAAVIEHVALVVPGAGRVGMIFASPPRRRSRADEESERALEALIDAACGRAAAARPGDLALIQALTEPGQVWLRRALVGASFQTVGKLLYLRRPNVPPGGTRPAVDDPWPGGVRVVTAAALGARARQDRVLCDCLERSYEGTLDCPELFGLRQTADILASHRACGRHDPSLWWLAMREERAVACALFNPYPDQGSVELVYLGLAPEIRGKGLGLRLMEFGLHALARMSMQRVACAVDERNAPARRLYDRLGFDRFDTREAFVRRP